MAHPMPADALGKMAIAPSPSVLTILPPHSSTTVAVVALGIAAGLLVFGRGDTPDQAGAVTSTTTTVAPVSAAPPVEPVPEEDYCAVVAEFENAVGNTGPADRSPEAFQAYFRTSLAYLDRMVPVAPQEVKGPVTALRDGIAGLAAGGDPTAADPALLSARQQFEAFNAKAC